MFGINGETRVLKRFWLEITRVAFKVVVLYKYFPYAGLNEVFQTNITKLVNHYQYKKNIKYKFKTQLLPPANAKCTRAIALNYYTIEAH